MPAQLATLSTRCLCCYYSYLCFGRNVLIILQPEADHSGASDFTAFCHLYSSSSRSSEKRIFTWILSSPHHTWDWPVLVFRLFPHPGDTLQIFSFPALTPGLNAGLGNPAGFRTQEQGDYGNQDFSIVHYIHSRPKEKLPLGIVVGGIESDVEGFILTMVLPWACAVTSLCVPRMVIATKHGTNPQVIFMTLRSGCVLKQRPVPWGFTSSSQCDWRAQIKDAGKLKASLSSDREVTLHFLPDTRLMAEHDMRMSEAQTASEEKQEANLPSYMYTGTQTNLCLTLTEWTNTVYCDLMAVAFYNSSAVYYINRT